MRWCSQGYTAPRHLCRIPASLGPNRLLGDLILQVQGNFVSQEGRSDNQRPLTIKSNISTTDSLLRKPVCPHNEMSPSAHAQFRGATASIGPSRMRGRDGVTAQAMVVIARRAESLDLLHVHIQSTSGSFGRLALSEGYTDRTGSRGFLGSWYRSGPAVLQTPEGVVVQIMDGRFSD